MSKRSRAIRLAALTAVLSGAIALVPSPAMAEDIEIGGPCADKDIVVIVPNPANDDKVKVCANYP